MTTETGKGRAERGGGRDGWRKDTKRGEREVGGGGLGYHGQKTGRWQARLKQERRVGRRRKREIQRERGGRGED